MRIALAALLALVATPAAASITEAQAITIVRNAVTQVAFGAPAPACLAYDVEAASRTVFEIAVREQHAGKCGGDPDVMPVIERFRVTRSPAGLWHYDIVNDEYRRCRLTKRLRPTCARRR